VLMRFGMFILKESNLGWRFVLCGALPYRFVFGYHILSALPDDCQGGAETGHHQRRGGGLMPGSCMPLAS
jgi:hypothetical protein